MSSTTTVCCRSFMSRSDLQETTLKLKVINEIPNHQQTCLLENSENPTNEHYLKILSQDSAQFFPKNWYRLSPQSLELCTENLGSETGTDTISTANDVNEPSSNQLLILKNCSSTSTGKLQKSPCERTVKNKKSGSSFPPPLTTMSGSSSMQVMRHRENGRLIIDAVERPMKNGGVLQAERSGGRLRLSFLNSPEDVGDEAVEEMNGPRGGVDDVEEDIVDDKHQWMSIRCKDGGDGGNNNIRSDDNHWNKPSLWIATS